MKKLITLALALLGGLGGCGYSDPADWLTATMRTDQEVCDQTGRCKNGTKPTVRTYRPYMVTAVNGKTETVLLDAMTPEEAEKARLRHLLMAECDGRYPSAPGHVSEAYMQCVRNRGAIFTINIHE